jgi:CheY-like chemotaxis protein
MSKTILVVDDNRDAVDIMRSILVSNGFTVVAAYNGVEALTQVGTQRPDLIVLDVMMPRMSGMEVLERLKDLEETAHIPVMMCTAKVQDNDLLEGYRCGADYYITKPFTAQQLMYGVGLLLGIEDQPRS